MRPYNTYRNPELSQPVSSVENTLSSKTSNSNAAFDILRSLSESISVDCGSFAASSSTEYYQASSTPSRVAFVDPNGKEIRTPVESAPAAPVEKEPTIAAQVFRKTSVNAASDMDDDNYDCMNDPNYRTQCVKEADSPSFEELLARTAESIAKMREETQTSNSNPGNDDWSDKRSVAENSKKTFSQSKGATTEPVQNLKQEEKTSIDPQSKKKSFLSSKSFDKFRRALFSRETIKLVVLCVAISALIASAVIYKNSPSRNNGLTESDNVVVNQPMDVNLNVPVQGNEITDNNEFKASDNGDYWGQSDNNWNDPTASNRQAMTDSFQDDYQSRAFDVNPIENPSDFSNPEDAGRLLASPHNSNADSQFVDAMPVNTVGPQYAEVSPALGAQYNQDEYESPVLEDDTVSGYSETGYNSNFMR